MKKLLSLIKSHQAEFVNFRFVDILGHWHEITYHVSMVTEDLMTTGCMFDGSSLLGWKSIENSDMILQPDDKTACVDMFRTNPTISILCNVVDTSTNELYNRDPRSTAIRAEKFLKETGIADEARFGPEPEFFIFDSVHYSTDPENSFFKITSEENPSHTRNFDSSENYLHHTLHKASYCSTSPIDLAGDMRSKMLLSMLNAGIPIEKHHHEVATSQHELGFKYASPLMASDYLCQFKQIVKEVALSHGKIATFMPKPLENDNGSGMHVHQSLVKNGENIFAGNDYAGLSKTALYYIGGVLKHGKALNAFTNPTINSYKRLIPGFEAPTLAVYSAKNRSAACRIPHTNSANARRIEARFPDPSSNPYLAFSALLMAGLDGIINQIDPGQHFEQNLYELSEKELKKLPHLASSLEEALENLNQDRDFLKAGNVFSDDQIDSYINVKKEEIKNFRTSITPKEYESYFSC